MGAQTGVRGRPGPVPKSSVTPQEIQEIVTATTTAPDGTPRRAYPLVDKVLERQEHLKNEVLANGTNAKAAAASRQKRTAKRDMRRPPKRLAELYHCRGRGGGE